MTNKTNNQDLPDERENKTLDKANLHQGSHQAIEHPVTTTISSVGGGIAGAAIGKKVAGPLGQAVGAVGGAVVGAATGEKVAKNINPTLKPLTPLSDEESMFVWKLHPQPGNSQLVWELSPKSTDIKI